MRDTTLNSLLPLELKPLPLVATGTARSTTPDAVSVLTRRLATGDEEAFREFHEMYFDRIYRFLLAVTRGDEDAAREAVQETLLRVLRHVRVFDDDEIFWCWLKAVARNTARDRLRRRHRYFALLERFSARVDLQDAGEEEAMNGLLEESLGELAADERRLVEQKYLEGRSIREISEMTGATGKAVESRLLRLRRHLRQRILEKLNPP